MWQNMRGHMIMSLIFQTQKFLTAEVIVHTITHETLESWHTAVTNNADTIALTIYNAHKEKHVIYHKAQLYIIYIRTYQPSTI